MTVMSINETAVAPGTGRLALNSFKTLRESALEQRGPRLYPCYIPRADSTTSKSPPSNANRSGLGSRVYGFDA